MITKNKLYRTAVAVAVTGVLSACASTHGLAPQSSMNKPDTLQASATLANTAVSTDAWPDSQWWTQFQDPQLNQLIAEGLAGSPTLRVAEARTRAALAQARVAQSARRPQVDAKGSVTRERFPEQSLIPPPFAAFPPLTVRLSIVTAAVLVAAIVRSDPVPPLLSTGCVDPVPTMVSVSVELEGMFTVTDSAYGVDEPATFSVTAVPVSASAAVTPSWIVLHAPAPADVHPVVAPPLTLST